MGWYESDTSSRSSTGRGLGLGGCTEGDSLNTAETLALIPKEGKLVFVRHAAQLYLIQRLAATVQIGGSAKGRGSSLLFQNFAKVVIKLHSLGPFLRFIVPQTFPFVIGMKRAVNAG